MAPSKSTEETRRAGRLARVYTNAANQHGFDTHVERAIEIYRTNPPRRAPWVWIAQFLHNFGWGSPLTSQTEGIYCM